MIDAYTPMPPQRLITREGYPFMIICAVPAALFAAWGWYAASAAFLGLFVFVCFFFRNPERAIPANPACILAPADGRVISVCPLKRAPYLDGPATKVSIFMSVLDVHVNRLPVSALVRRVDYQPGAFFIASRDKASEHNERNALVLEDGQGRLLAMVQIAGLVARRIVCYMRSGDRGGAGDRVGMIRFGSRVDLYVPPPHSIEVKPGDRVKAGKDVIGRWT